MKVRWKKTEDSKSTSSKPLVQAVEAEIEFHDRPDISKEDQGLLDMNHQEENDMFKLPVQAIVAEIEEERPERPDADADRHGHGQHLPARPDPRPQRDADVGRPTGAV